MLKCKVERKSDLMNDTKDNKSSNGKGDQNIKNKPGISLKIMQISMIVIASLVSFALLYYTYVSYNNYQNLSDATDEFISLQGAAEGLMDASDHLTEMAQRFTNEGDLTYLNAYFEEANVTKRRENALEVIKTYPECSTALEMIQKALDNSIELMNREYYSMRLVIDAKGYTDYPDELSGIKLSENDAALSPEEKMTLARHLLIDDIYYLKKDSIRANLNAGQEELARLSGINRDHLEELYQKNTKMTQAIIIAQVVSFLLVMILTLTMGLYPLLRAINDIQEDNKLKVAGAKEYRYLANAYNKMFDAHQASIRQLNYKASHDELTDAYNRTGYDLILEEVDLKTTCFIIVDVDDFKNFNDTMGHEIGDKVLKRVADTLKQYFRSVDYICRIGGDEFAVIVTGIDHNKLAIISGKLNAIRKDLSSGNTEEPPITLSIGVSHGYYSENIEEMFEQADKALYETKEKGKDGYTFFRS